MLNANGPGFAGLYAGDVVQFFIGAPRHDVAPRQAKTAAVIPMLVFADHVQVRYGNFGYTVDAFNFVRIVRRGKRHIAADKARTGCETLPYVRAVDERAELRTLKYSSKRALLKFGRRIDAGKAEAAYDERLATVDIGPQEAYTRAITGADPHATRKLVRAMRSDSCTQCGGSGQRRDIERGDDNCAECDGTGRAQ